MKQLRMIIHWIFFFPALLLGCVFGWIEQVLRLDKLGIVTAILRWTLFLPASLTGWLSIGVDKVLRIEELENELYGED
jgi:uncharacterized membrane protein